MMRITILKLKYQKVYKKLYLKMLVDKVILKVINIICFYWCNFAPYTAFRNYLGGNFTVTNRKALISTDKRIM
jgi:hypothetical protein